jgi:wyosine [tRNA(Phe)-imidazoG37] synthetase (radical SAM superfamily)
LSEHEWCAQICIWCSADHPLKQPIGRRRPTKPILPKRIPNSRRQVANPRWSLLARSHHGAASVPYLALLFLQGRASKVSTSL